jgi:hypothetical protein
LFGIVTYGVQLLAYQDNADGPSIWVARRAKTKRTFPSMLDSTVGGSLPTGEQPFECPVHEAEEEEMDDVERHNESAQEAFDHGTGPDRRRDAPRHRIQTYDS